MQVFVRPIKGVLVRDPRSMQVLPETGQLVELNSFWNRRIKDGSVFLFDEKKKESTVEVKKKLFKEDKHD